MEIPDIRTRNLDVPEIDILGPSVPQVFTGYPVPVTVEMGIPIVNMPGCVETRETDDLREIDPRGNMTFCDGNVPSFNPIQFEPNRKLPTAPAGVDTRQRKTPPIDD